MLELEVLDVDPLGAERLRDPREDARPVGDVDADALELAGVAVRAFEHPPAVGGGLADPAREEAGVPFAERRLDLLDTAPVSASAPRIASALSRKMSIQMRGFAPAMRVMSRSEPPALGERFVAVRPARRRPD